MRAARPTLTDTASRYHEAIATTQRPCTVLTYRTALGDLIAYLETAHPDLKSFALLKRRPHIQGWLTHLCQRGALKASTRRAYIIRVRHFLQDIAQWGWREAPRVALLSTDDLPPPDHYLPRPLSPDDDQALRRYLEGQDDFVAIALLVLRGTGLRVGEGLALKRDCLERISPRRRFLHVPLGKLHSERVIPVDAETARRIEQLQRLRKEAPPFPDPRSGKPEHFLIAWENGKPPSYTTMRNRLLKAAEMAGCKHPLTIHQLRHSFATELLRGDIPLPALMHLLGHRTIAMTLRYAKVTQADVERAYFKAHEQTKHQYDFHARTGQPAPELNPSLQSIMTALETARSLMESFRRDIGAAKIKSKARRIVERIHRIARDFETLYR